MSRTILVRGFGPGTTKRDILALFTLRSDVRSLRLVEAHGEPVQRRCFVRMTDHAAADRAVHELDGRRCDGGILWVDVVGHSRADGVADAPAPRDPFQPTSAETHGAHTPAAPGPVAVSFVVGARAFAYLAATLPALQPLTRVAVEQARDRGGIAAMYYFIDVAENVVRDVRNSLRARSRRKDPDGRACDAAASAIEGRRRSAWYLRPCPRCGGRLGPASWLTPAVFLLECAGCRWTIPK